MFQSGRYVSRHISYFLSFWTNLTTCGPMYYKNKCLSLHKKSVFYDITIKTMDSTLPSTPHHLFAYCIKDGILDELPEEQRTSIIHIIESMLSEREYTIIESLLSEGEDANSERLLSGENSISERLLSGEYANENKSIFG